MSDTKYKPQESVADFRERLAIMMRERETGKKYSIIGAARPNECVLRPRDPQSEARRNAEREVMMYDSLSDDGRSDGYGESHAERNS